MFIYFISGFICFGLGMLIGALLVPAYVEVGIVIGAIFAVVGVCIVYKFEHEDSGDDEDDDSYEEKRKTKSSSNSGKSTAQSARERAVKSGTNFSPKNHTSSEATTHNSAVSPRSATSVNQATPSKSGEYVQEDVDDLIRVCEQQYLLAQATITTIWKCDSGSVFISLMTDRIYVVISSDDKKHITDHTINASDFTNYNIVFTKIAKPVFKELAARHPGCEITNNSICIKVKSTENTPSTSNPASTPKQIGTPKTATPTQSPASARSDTSQLSKDYTQSDIEVLIKICEQFYKETREYMHKYSVPEDCAAVSIATGSEGIRFAVVTEKIDGCIFEKTYLNRDFTNCNIDFSIIAESFIKELTIRHPNWNVRNPMHNFYTFNVKY